MSQVSGNADRLDALHAQLFDAINDRDLIDSDVYPYVYERACAKVRAIETAISDLQSEMFTHADEMEVEFIFDADDYSTIQNDARPMLATPEGYIDLVLTAQLHAKRLNVWRDRARNLMVGRVRVTRSPKGRPIATCTHCGWALMPVHSNYATRESFIIAVIAHGQNDGPAYARKYIIAEQVYYRPAIVEHKSAKNVIAANTFARLMGMGAFAKPVTVTETIGAIVDNGQLARLSK